MGRNPVTWLGSPAFPDAARAALADTQLRGNLAHATSTIRTKRAAAVAELPDWERLRRAGEAIKDDVLSHLDVYLTRLEASVTARGGQVHWARDARRPTRSCSASSAPRARARSSRSSRWPPRRSG